METCRECDKEFETLESVFRHQRSHGQTAQEYVLKWHHGGTVPLCACGCGRNTSWNIGMKNFTTFVKGHSSKGKTKTEDEKRRIGEKNKINMTRWMGKHPDVARKRGSLMNKATLTPEVQRKKSESIHRFWSSSPFADLLRKEASERALKLLEEGKIGPQAPFKREWVHNPWSGKDEYMHSSWESSFFQTCLKRGYPVFKSHGITIPYVHPDGSQRTYVPDFYAPDDRVLYEVKGRHDEVDTAKWEAAARFCEEKGWRFEVLFEEES